MRGVPAEGKAGVLSVTDCGAGRPRLFARRRGALEPCRSGATAFGVPESRRQIERLWRPQNVLWKWVTVCERGTASPPPGDGCEAELRCGANTGWDWFPSR